MAANQYTGVTNGGQIAAQNAAAADTANQSVMSTAHMPAMSVTSQPGIIAGGMRGMTEYNGQQVATDDQTKQSIIGAAKSLGVDPMEYDKSLNPTTYGARWGIADPNAGASSVSPASNANITGPESTAEGYTPAQLGNPNKWDVTSDQTVQGQMQKLIDPNSPFYQQWATAGAEDAAARGFTGNSSIRNTGILDAVMRGATPIATSDASTYAKSAGYNADQSNQFAMANAAAQNVAGQFDASQANTAAANKLSSDTAKYTAELSSATQKYISDQNAATQQAVAKMSNQSQQTISQVHDANSVLLQNNQSAQAAYSAYVNAVANIDIQPSMDANAKAAAIATQTQIFNAAIAGLKSATPGTPDTSSPLDISHAVQQVGGVDVSQYLNFSL